MLPIRRLLRFSLHIFLLGDLFLLLLLARLALQVYRHIVSRLRFNLLLSWQGLFQASGVSSFTRERVSARSSLTIQHCIGWFKDADVAGPPKYLDPVNYACSLSTEFRSYFFVRFITDNHIDISFCQLHIGNISAVARLGNMQCDYSLRLFVLPLLTVTHIEATTYAIPIRNKKTS